MKVKVSELEGGALDWAVGRIEGKPVKVNPLINGKPSIQENDLWHRAYSPSSDWSQGGPLIEKLNVELMAPTTMERYWTANVNYVRGLLNGSTPLIAACRAIVAAKLGDEVEVPDELA